MEVSTINASGKLAGLLSSITILITGSLIFLKSMTLDMSTFIRVCEVSIPGGICAGILGYMMGKILEAPHHSKKSKSSKNIKNNRPKDLLIDDLLVKDIDKSPIQEPELGATRK